MFATLLMTLAQTAVSGFMGDGALARYAQMGIAALGAGISGEPRLKALTAHVKMMAAEGREPTEAEFDALGAQDEAADLRIEAEAKRRGIG